jgi:hypothetical protein
MPEVGKYNGGQKLLFWLFGCACWCCWSPAADLAAWFAPSVPIGCNASRCCCMLAAFG